MRTKICLKRQCTYGIFKEINFDTNIAWLECSPNFRFQSNDTEAQWTEICPKVPQKCKTISQSEDVFSEINLSLISHSQREQKLNFEKIFGKLVIESTD